MTKKMVKKSIDRTSLYGILSAFTLIFLAIISSGNILPYFDVASILIVIGGTICVTYACFTSDTINSAISFLKTAFFGKRIDFNKEATKVMYFIDIAYKKGILILQNYHRNEFKSDFLSDAIHASVDNSSHKIVEDHLRNKITVIEEQYLQSISVFRKAAEISPAMGLIGTLIGLVRMLGNIDDVSSIGPAMAVALLTTFYGAIISYLVCFPIATKLEQNLSERIQLYELYTQAAIAINRKEHPRNVEAHLNSIIPINHQIKFY